MLPRGFGNIAAPLFIVTENGPLQQNLILLGPQASRFELAKHAHFGNIEPPPLSVTERSW